MFCNQEKILLYTDDYKNIYRFLNLKNEIFLFFENPENCNIKLKPHQTQIENRKYLTQMFFLDIFIIIGIKKNVYSLITEIFGSIPKIKKVILIENKNEGIKSELNKSLEVLSQLELKIFSKRKSLISLNKKNFFNKRETKFIIVRRNNLPLLCKLKIKAILKLFFHKFNNKLGSLVNNEKFYLSMNVVDFFCKSKITGRCYSRRGFKENFQRISEELGILLNKPTSLKIKSILYLLSL